MKLILEAEYFVVLEVLVMKYLLEVNFAVWHAITNASSLGHLMYKYIRPYYHCVDLSPLLSWSRLEVPCYILLQ